MGDYVTVINKKEESDQLYKLEEKNKIKKKHVYFRKLSINDKVYAVFYQSVNTIYYNLDFIGNVHLIIFKRG